MAAGVVTTVGRRCRPNSYRRRRYVGSPPAGSAGSIHDVEHLADRAGREHDLGLAERVEHPALLRVDVKLRRHDAIDEPAQPQRRDRRQAEPHDRGLRARTRRVAERGADREARRPGLAARAGHRRLALVGIGGRRWRRRRCRMRLRAGVGLDVRRHLHLRDARRGRGRDVVDLGRLLALGQDARATRAPVRGRLAVERGVLILQARRAPLAPGEPARRVLELRLDLLGAIVVRRAVAGMHAPRPVDVEPGRADRQLGRVEHDGRARLVAALGVGAHEDPLLRPLFGDHHHRSMMARRRRWAAQPVVDKPDLGHA
jgi:hypothetical protein